MVTMIALQIGSVNNASAKGVVACNPTGVWDYGDDSTTHAQELLAG